MENALPQEGYVRIKQLLGSAKEGIPPILPIKKSALWSWVANGKFPPPLRLTPGVTVWSVKDIRTFLELGRWPG